jgi:hypothetical protein
MLTLVDRDADALAAWGRIGPELCASLKAEARRRAEADEFADVAACQSIRTGIGDGSAAGGTGRGSSKSTVGVNQWPRSQLVFTCSTGPEVDPQVQRSTILAGAWQAGSGQAIMLGMAASLSWVLLSL